MSKTNIADSNYVIASTVTVREVLEAITDNQRGSVVVVDDAMHLVGLISDGDLRRAFLRGSTIHSRIEGIVNLRPTILLAGSSVDADARVIFENNDHITLIPVVNSDNVVVDVKVRNPKVRKEVE